MSGQLPSWKIASWVGLRFGLGLGLRLGLGANLLGGNCPRTRINNEVEKAVFSLLVNSFLD